MPYLRCRTCGVLSYVARGDARSICPECGVPFVGDASGDESADPDRRLDQLMRLTRELLDMDLALLTEIRDGRETARRAAGEWPGPMRFHNASVPLDETFCQRMLDGRIGHYIADARADSRVNRLAMARQLGVGAWLGVPIDLSDAELYVLCCLASEARPSLGDREVRLLAGLAESVRATLQSRAARPV